MKSIRCRRKRAAKRAELNVTREVQSVRVRQERRRERGVRMRCVAA